MKNMKRFAAFSVAAVMAVSMMAGCGGNGDSKDKSDSSDSAASGEETFLIGGIGPVTGAAASYGTSVKQGAEIAIKEINDAGGVKVGDTTYKFGLEFADDEASEDKAVQAYNTVMDKGANAITVSYTHLTLPTNREV